MKRLVAFLILGASLLTACSSTPEELPDCAIPAPMAEVAHGISVPEMPVETRRFEGGAEFDLDGLLQLDRVRKAGEANKTIAEDNALALEARNEEVNALIECARFQNIWIQMHQQDLRDEKQAHMLDNFWHRTLIALGFVAAVSL